MFNWFESNLTFSVCWLNKLRLLVSKHNLWWQEPLHNTSIFNEEVFEWWYYDHKLTIYIENKRVEYVKVWGTNIDTEMQTGSVTLSVTELDLWKWLVKLDD